MEDFLQLDDSLTADERLIRDTLRRFVDERVTNEISSHFEQGSFPETLIPQLAELGVFGMTLPDTYGCANSSYVAYGLACQELERGDSGIRSFVSVQSSLCMYPIFTFGSDAQKQQFLPAMSTGKIIGCFGLTEPDAGSDPSRMKTTAKKVDGGWLLNGSKMWITNAPVADLAIVWAQTSTHGDIKGIRGFLITKDLAGFHTKTIHHKLSLRASHTGELILQDCFIPDDNLLPGSDIGLRAPLSCLNQARYGIAWGAMGAAMACYEAALNYTLERKQFDKPVASFQLVQHDLAVMFTEICKAQTLNLQIGRLKDRGTASHVMVSMAKQNACEQALHIARTARNLLGANGISLEYHVIRHMNNLESVFTYEGTDNIHKLVLGKHITGINAFD